MQALSRPWLNKTNRSLLDIKSALTIRSGRFFVCCYPFTASGGISAYAETP